MNPDNIVWVVFGALSIAGSAYGLWCAWGVDREYRKRKRTPEIDWKRNPRVGMDEWDADFRKLSKVEPPDYVYACTGKDMDTYN